ncbi:hypothetical protein FEM48_Zijuj02G0029900 [Ziziphus jujuba var. spinosa]|uniref:Histidine-containing phosphotransfer protein n=1 Tax=Ziziphus jujuba var. spinosa TaxID=714518 RepID=A0A978VT82_ZIZJJ|nr:hypothetical protein FEM48_Zijuj02G0029900 [Ziziphus jujuba var. spinosa]
MLICIPGVNPQGTMQNSWQSDNHCLSNLSLKLLYLHAELFHSHHGLKSLSLSLSLSLSHTHTHTEFQSVKFVSFISEMALSILEGLLEEYVQSLFDEGIVNDQFSQIQTLKSMEQPDLVVQLIDAYLVDVEMILSELTSYSDFPDVDFSKVTLLAHKVKDRSSCIGAEHVRLACDELIQASVQMNKQKYEAWSCRWSVGLSDLRADKKVKLVHQQILLEVCSRRAKGGSKIPSNFELNL